ncbi:Zinc finger protein 454 [Plakobranchus ocellatus]|uniref:Zinc finger protein 454 n=1 Tax=Plakobranchus ocellatus TaxID=259542 RepID=A0AAV4B2V1_9GAST|nr:Zinc finger protein 454 [Plakobranchus ocellatus]
MDYDSSTKFISSLAKFLQSLCNGYVEFDNGVQVIGHLYLNVDTGKTIDYVLNEKVCKTDENSVTFISNSFHAQPAEKPKPPGKQSDQDSEKNLKAEDLENSNQGENRPSNASSRNQSSNSHAGTKRPNSPQKQSKQDRSGRASPKSKKSRTDFDSVDSTLSENIDSNSAAAYQQSLSHEASFNESYQQNFFPNDENSLGDGQEQRDVKPTFDTDVTFIKEEYAPSSGLQADNQDDGSQVDNSSAYSHSYSNQQFHPGGYSNQSSFNSSNQRSSFNPAGDRSMFNSGTSQMEGGDISNDPSGTAELSAIGQHCFPPTSRQPNSEFGRVGSYESQAITHHGLDYVGSKSDPIKSPVPGLKKEIRQTSIVYYKGPPRWADRARKFSCYICEKSFVANRDLEGHINSVHLKCKPFQSIIESIFNEESKTSLQSTDPAGFGIPFGRNVVNDGLDWKSLNLQQSNLVHVSGDIGLGPRKFRSLFRSFDIQCKKCAFTSRDPLVMANHKRLCNGKKHLTCTVCSKVLSRYDALAEHLRGIHGIGEKVGCKFCGKNFKYRPQMYQHQAVCPLRPPKSESVLLSSQTVHTFSHADEDANAKLSFPYDVMTTTSGGTGTYGNIAMDQKDSSLIRLAQ